MAYKRTYRRRMRRKTPWYKKKYNAYQLAKKAAKGVYYLKGLVNSELLQHQGSSTVNVTTTATISQLTQISQDDTVSGRTGNSILLRSIFLRFGIATNTLASATYVRIILFQDTQQIGDTAPAITDILESSSCLAPINRSTKGRFKILKNWFFMLDNLGKNSTKTVEKYLNMYSHIRYNGAASSDIQKNGIYFAYLSDQVTNYPSMSFYYRLGYHDN